MSTKIAVVVVAVLALGSCTALVGLDEDYELSSGVATGTTTTTGSGGQGGGGEGGGGEGGGGGTGSATGPAGSGGFGGFGGSLPESLCGNAALDPGEACDDANTDDGDRCSSDCRCGSDDADAYAYANTGNGHCYVWVTTPTPVSIALGACAVWGMYNATVTTEQERQFLEQFLGRPGQLDTWLGGKDEDSEGTWYWLSGEPWATSPCNPANVPGCDNSVSFWDTDQPSGGDTQDCLALNANAKMHDWPCDGFNFAYLCEK